MPTNIPFLVSVVQHPAFAKQLPTTAFFEDHLEGILNGLKTTHTDGSVEIDMHMQFALLAFLQADLQSGRTLLEAIPCFSPLLKSILCSGSAKGSSPWTGFGSGGNNSLQNWRTLRPQTVVRQVRVAQGSGSGMGAIQQVKVSVQPQSPDLLQFSRAVDKENGSKDGGKGGQPQEDGELVQLLSSRRLQSESDGASVWQLSAQLGSHRIQGVVSLFPRSGGTGLGIGLQADVWLEGRLAQDATQRTFWLPLASTVSYSTNSRQANTSFKIIIRSLFFLANAAKEMRFRVASCGLQCLDEW